MPEVSALCIRRCLGGKSGCCIMVRRAVGGPELQHTLIIIAEIVICPRRHHRQIGFTHGAAGWPNFASAGLATK